MKILVFANYDMGLYKFRKELLESLLINNDVVLYLPVGDFREDLEKLGCKCVPFEFNRRGMNPFADISQLLKYKKIIKKEKADIVLTYTIKPNVYGGMACRITKTPYIANITGLGTAIENGGFVGKLSETLYKIGLKRAACIFFQNEKNKQTFENKKIINTKSRLIPGSGVNLSDHNSEQYPADENLIRFLFVGRIMKDKGIGELLEAAQTVHKAYPNIDVSIVGGCDENYDTELKNAESSGYVHYYGAQKDVHQFYKTAHCTVLPTYHEGTANVLLESASTGRPIIATRVPGCQETFDEGVTGLGCEVKNAQSLADAMIKFIELPYEIKKQMGVEGRKKMEREYDRQIVIDAYLEEINKAVGNGNSEV